jgi:topoisomerase-4 subunit A
MDVPEKLFVDTDMLHCMIADKDEMAKLTFTAVYREDSTGLPYVKRFQIDKFILNKGYQIQPEGCTLMGLTVNEDGFIKLEYHPKPRVKILEDKFKIRDYLVKSVKAGGVRMAPRDLKAVSFEESGKKPSSPQATPVEPSGLAVDGTDDSGKKKPIEKNAPEAPVKTKAPKKTAAKKAKKTGAKKTAARKPSAKKPAGAKKKTRR